MRGQTRRVSQALRTPHYSSPTLDTVDRSEPPSGGPVLQVHAREALAQVPTSRRMNLSLQDRHTALEHLQLELPQLDILRGEENNINQQVARPRAFRERESPCANLSFTTVVVILGFFIPHGRIGSELRGSHLLRGTVIHGRRPPAQVWASKGGKIAKGKQRSGDGVGEKEIPYPYCIQHLLELLQLSRAHEGAEGTDEARCVQLRPTCVLLKSKTTKKKRHTHTHTHTHKRGRDRVRARDPLL